MTIYERIYPPSYTSKDDPKCPECGERMFYVGLTTELRVKRWDMPVDKSNFVEHKLYQCGTCRRLYQQLEA